MKQIEFLQLINNPNPSKRFYPVVPKPKEKEHKCMTIADYKAAAVKLNEYTEIFRQEIHERKMKTNVYYVVKNTINAIISAVELVEYISEELEKMFPSCLLVDKFVRNSEPIRASSVTDFPTFVP